MLKTLQLDSETCMFAPLQATMLVHAGLFRQSQAKHLIQVNGDAGCAVETCVNRIAQAGALVAWRF